MATTFEPIIGQWYQDLEGRIFDVVARDESAVGIQYFDGDIEEFDMETWFMLDVFPVPEPKDGTGPFDDLEKDDLGDIEEPFQPLNWQSPLDRL